MAAKDASFKALYLDADGNVTERVIAQPHSPGPSESLVQVTYSGINPADIRHYFMGMNSFVMGYDFVGTIHTPSSSPSSLNQGDQVLGMTWPGDHRPLHAGAHQAFLIPDPDLIWLRPDDLDPLTAVGMPAAILTAADALFNCLGFGLPQAGVTGDVARGEAILIWGGASNVGWAAVQLAKAAGFQHIFVTASERNHQSLLEAGATQCFDYNSPNVVDGIRSASDQLSVHLHVSFDAVCMGLGIFEPLTDEEKVTIEANYERSTPGLAKQALSQHAAAKTKKLASSLPVLKDRDWQFALFSRKEQAEEHPGWWERQKSVINWVLANHGAAWKPFPKVTTVESSGQAIDGVRRSFAGKLSLEKLVIKHPLL